MHKRILCAGFAMLALSAQADLMATNGMDWIKLAQPVCTNPVILPMIREEHRDKFKSGSAHVVGRNHQVCWVDTMEGAYVVFFDDGDIVALPITAFVEAGI